MRPLFRRRRELLGELARAGAEAVKELVRHASGEGDSRPGLVVCVVTAGDLLQWHPHLGEPVAAEDKKRLEDTAAYLVRNPLSLKKLVYLDGPQACSTARG